MTWKNGDCFGTPVIEASRLCVAARGGQVLAAELVRLTARARGGDTFTPDPRDAAQRTAGSGRRLRGEGGPLELEEMPLPPRLTTPQTLAIALLNELQ